MAFQDEFSRRGDAVVDVDVPPEYKVVLLNDDFTTKDFVVDVLMSIFHKSPEEAVAIMTLVHKTGRGVAGIYPYDIAATRAEMAMRRARSEGFPLKCATERA